MRQARQTNHYTYGPIYCAIGATRPENRNQRNDTVVVELYQPWGTKRPLRIAFGNRKGMHEASGTDSITRALISGSRLRKPLESAAWVDLRIHSDLGRNVSVHTTTLAKLLIGTDTDWIDHFWPRSWCWPLFETLEGQGSTELDCCIVKLDHSDRCGIHCGYFWFIRSFRFHLPERLQRLLNCYLNLLVTCYLFVSLLLASGTSVQANGPRNPRNSLQWRRMVAHKLRANIFHVSFAMHRNCRCKILEIWIIYMVVSQHRLDWAQSSKLLMR